LLLIIGTAVFLVEGYSVAFSETFCRLLSTITEVSTRA
jgi:hypothetical protein